MQRATPARVTEIEKAAFAPTERGKRDEWEVVGVVVVLIGLVASIVKPILALNGSIIKLNTLLNALTDRNHDEHETISKRLREHGQQIDDHEGRIIRLEEHKTGGGET